MTNPLLSPIVLRRMVMERIEAAHRGEISADELRG